MLVKIFKLSDKHDHDLKCEWMTVYLSQLVGDVPAPHVSLFAHLLTIISAKATMDGQGYRIMGKLIKKYGVENTSKLFELEQKIVKHVDYALPHHPWMIDMNQWFNRVGAWRPGPSFKMLLRYAALCDVQCNFITLMVAFQLLRHDHIINNIIKFSKLYRLFHQLVKENENLQMRDLILMSNQIKLINV